MTLLSQSYFDHIESDMLVLGRYGCLLFALCSIATEYIQTVVDPVLWYRLGVNKGLIGQDCYIHDSTELLRQMTGVVWTRKIVGSLPDKILDNQYTVEKWVNGSVTHFRRRPYDFLVNSTTVAKGKLEAYYIYEAATA